MAKQQLKNRDHPHDPFSANMAAPGQLCKVVYSLGPPRRCAVLQSSAAVHRGCSGGALVAGGRHLGGSARVTGGSQARYLSLVQAGFSMAQARWAMINLEVQVPHNSSDFADWGCHQNDQGHIESVCFEALVD
eukprot:Skav223181  [mRNA]  locus=scaffold2044:194275:194673:+ [translate_table: standard]